MRNFTQSTALFCKLALFALAISGAVVAIPAKAQQSEEPIALAAPVGLPGKPGRFQAANGNLTGKPHIYRTGGVSILMPVSVIANASDPAKPIQLEIVKYDGGKPDRSVRSDAKGVAATRFRTEGEFTIRIIGGEGTAYRLIVWRGDERKEQVPSAFLHSATDAAKR